MRWPCVSRARFDDMSLTRVTRDTELREAWDRINSLTDTIIRMKKEGFVGVPDYSAYIDQPLTVDEQDALHAQEEGS